MTQNQKNLLAVVLLVLFFGLLAAAGAGWWNFLGCQMVSRGDLREACYLATYFDDYVEQHGALPTAREVESFPSRLKFLRIEGHKFLFACGLYGHDLLVIQRDPNGGFDFFVEGDGNR